MSSISRLRKKLTDAECVLLDGANGTELQRLIPGEFQLSDDTHWGFEALETHGDVVSRVHQSYVDVGCDVITTNTYSILAAPDYPGATSAMRGDPAHWMDLARHSVRLARKAIARSKVADDQVAVAFSIGGDVCDQNDLTTLELLFRVFETDPPDFILFETVSMVGETLTQDAIQLLIENDWPVWVSFRRCRQGACGIHGQLWGGPEGDRFGRLARELEQQGVEAILVNCLPVDRVEDTVQWLRDFTDVPLGVYPNLGRALESGWQFANEDARQEFIDLALQWKAQGAGIIGGCCGIGPDDIRLLSERFCNPVTSTSESITVQKSVPTAVPTAAPQQPLPGWTDKKGRQLYPLPLPDLQVDNNVFMPTQGSYLIWKFLYRECIGKDKTCLDIGCGAGILAVQLALNGASNVTAIDINSASVENTQVNAYRNGVAETVDGLVQDLYTFVPETPYQVIVASLYQMPTDPTGKTSGHRDVDYWGRNLLDHFISQLPTILAGDGIAYVMQVSMLGANKTTELLQNMGYQCKVLDFNLYQFNETFKNNLPQIKQVESLSDAYHFSFDESEHVMVMYLIEITAID